MDTVDGFQGREKEAIVISLVRPNPECEIGFLSDTRRMNVALTRARRKLLVVGDMATLAGHDFYRQLLDYIESIGAYHSVWNKITSNCGRTDVPLPGHRVSKLPEVGRRPRRRKNVRVGV